MQQQLLGPREHNAFYPCVRERVPGKESNPSGSSQPRLDVGLGKHPPGGGGACPIWLKHVNFMFTLIISMRRRLFFPQRGGGSSLLSVYQAGSELHCPAQPFALLTDGHQLCRHAHRNNCISLGAG